MTNEKKISWENRMVPWSGMGTDIRTAKTAREALEMAHLDWNVVQENIYTENGESINGFKANIRDFDRSVLGVVSNKYQVVQNIQSFEWSEELVGEGFRYEAAGSWQNGKRVWVLMRLPWQYLIGSDRLNSYILLINSHDGNGAVKVAITPIRTSCSNMLNFAMANASRTWSQIHAGDIHGKIDNARMTLLNAENYMQCLGDEITKMRQKKITDAQVLEYIDILLPMTENSTPQQQKNILRQRNDMKQRFYNAPDLQNEEKNMYRFLNMAADYSIHADPLRRGANYRENLFCKSVENNVILDKAYQIACTA